MQVYLMMFFRVVSSKCKRYFCNCIKSAKHTRVAICRNYHKKGIHDEIVKRRRCARKRPFSKSSVVAVFEVIQKKRIEKFEVCDTIKEASLRYVLILNIYIACQLLPT
ncbi:60S ribosomal protein L24 [Apostasia shenzhenica]|uniref:60S ribosomal protein L24 n=1 Tax=Apostasia shenzhenica TaxID=1088818 RepID=A0A2I0BDZ0_9ASPA|nr:60S ribosomal protein L24 [Apostasia shenzhenica]